MSNNPTTSNPAPKILLDANGNLIDEQGRLIQAPKREKVGLLSSQGALKKAPPATSAKKRKLLKLYNADDVLKDKRRDMHWDKELEKTSRRRTYEDGRVETLAAAPDANKPAFSKSKRRRFNFHQHGKFVKMALRDRIRELFKEEQRRVTQQLNEEREKERIEEIERRNKIVEDNAQREDAALHLQLPQHSQQRQSAQTRTTLSELYLRNSEEYEFMELQMRLAGLDIASAQCPGLRVQNFLTDTDLDETKDEDSVMQMFQSNTNLKQHDTDKTFDTTPPAINSDESGQLFEWWDIRLLDKETKQVRHDFMQHSLVEHPPLIEPLVRIPDSGPLPLYMTKEERKKLKKQTKRQRQKELQLKIRIGLVPPPPPKANLKTFMRVHLESGTQDPTELEKRIRTEIAQRIANHEARNRENKLSIDQKHQKVQDKAQADADKELLHSIFLVDNLSHAQQQFKIKNQTQKMWITGCCLQCAEGPINIVIAEGGAQFSQKFQNVMLNKIKWNLTKSNIELTDLPEEEQNKCHLLWQGTNRKKHFRTFFWKQFALISELRAFMVEQLGFREYYELAMQKGNEIPVE